jgi:hypothetical protein
LPVVRTGKYFSGVHDTVGVDGRLECPHQVERAAVLPAHELPLAQPDAVFAGRRAAETDRSLDDCVRTVWLVGAGVDCELFAPAVSEMEALLRHHVGEKSAVVLRCLCPHISGSNRRTVNVRAGVQTRRRRSSPTRGIYWSTDTP